MLSNSLAWWLKMPKVIERIKEQRKIISQIVGTLTMFLLSPPFASPYGHESFKAPLFSEPVILLLDYLFLSLAWNHENDFQRVSDALHVLPFCPLQLPVF